MDIYKKPPLNYQEQLTQLESRGLIFDNKEKAIHLLENLNYYRLSAYLYPLLEVPKEKHKFKTGSNFESAFKMYCFDRELRLLLLGDIEKIEVSFRAKLTYVFSHKYDAFWYTYNKLFKKLPMHQNSLESISKSITDSTEDFVLKFNKKYLNHYPPSWMALEIVTFTHLSKIYENAKDTSAKAEVSASFGLPYQVFENWIHMLTYTRNMCAHHSRFWNRDFSIKVLKTTKPLAFDWIDQTGIARNKAYIYISILKYLLDRVNPKNTLRERLITLFEKYPTIDYIKGMEFPENWLEQPLWNKETNDN